MESKVKKCKLGEWIERKLADRNLTSAELAERAKIGRTTLHYILTGRNAPEDATIQKICLVLHADLSEAKTLYSAGVHTGRPKGTRNGKKTHGERLEQPSDVAPQADR